MLSKATLDPRTQKGKQNSRKQKSWQGNQSQKKKNWKLDLPLDWDLEAQQVKLLLHVKLSIKRDSSLHLSSLQDLELARKLRKKMSVLKWR